MRLWAPLLLLAGCASVPSHDALRATALTLRFESSWCSGNAVGPNLVQTAKHCKGRLIAVNGVPVNVRAIIEKAGDRVILALDQPYFRTWAALGPMPKQGDRIRFWGSPGGESDVFREGRVIKIAGDLIVIDAYACAGDSGSGLFSDKGEIVGVLSFLTVPDANAAGCRLTVAVPSP